MTEPAASASVQAPYFFLSYGRTPPVEGDQQYPDRSLIRFHRDLCRHIMQFTDLRADIPAGFLDQRIEVGADWEATLKRELARCQVLVPIYAPRFVSSDWCGREWQAFERRQQAQRERRTFTRNAIVPVMWTQAADLKLPAVCQEMQYFGGSAGQTYRSEGLYALTTGSRRLAYERTTLAIAREIVAVARSSRLEPCEVELFDDLGNAFEEEP